MGSSYNEGLVGGTGGVSDIVEDTTPQLGGDLDCNGFAMLEAAGISLLNDDWLSALNFAGAAEVNILKVNVDDEIDIGGTLVVGSSFEAVEDSGMVTLTDMPVSATPTAGDEMSFTQKIDGTNILTVGAEADSAGGIQNLKVVAHCGVNLKEITTPTAKADYGAVYAKANNKLYFQDGAGIEHEIAFV